MWLPTATTRLRSSSRVRRRSTPGQQARPWLLTRLAMPRVRTVIGDSDRSISKKYGMIDPGTSGKQSLPLTIRAVFIINPENKLMLSLNYPACVGAALALGTCAPWPLAYPSPSHRARLLGACAPQAATWTRSCAACRRCSCRTRSRLPPRRTGPTTTPTSRARAPRTRRAAAPFDPSTASHAAPPPSRRPRGRCCPPRRRFLPFIAPPSRAPASQGSVFLLPTVSDEEAKANYPGFYTCDVPSGKPYLRLVKQNVVGGPAPTSFVDKVKACLPGM